MLETLSSLKVGWLLGTRQLRRTSFWVTALIIVIMTLSFLSNVLISGILVGLIAGSEEANRHQYTGNVFISELSDESFIQNTTKIRRTLDRLDQVVAYSTRYVSGATVEANYKTRRDFNSLPNSVGVSVAGINPVKEDVVTDLADSVIEGEYLDEDQSGYILIGATLLERYSAFSDQFEPLKDVYVGDKVKISLSGSGNSLSPNTRNTIDDTQYFAAGDSASNVQEFTVKGIIDTKVGLVSTRVFMTESDFRRLTGRTNLSGNEIAVTIDNSLSEDEFKNILIKNDFDQYAKIQTAQEAIPQFLDDVKSTFNTLGFLIGIIISGVGAITIFIVIYINAIVRRKQIGILKGIGIIKSAIIYSYIFQALIYAFVGVGIALLLTYFVFIPYVDRNPIDFPFSDGIIAVDFSLLISRLIIVFITSFLAGLLPAWLIARHNTLDSILGR